MRCLGSKVLSECSADEMQAIKDLGIYSSVTQWDLVIRSVCNKYVEGNTGGFNFMEVIHSAGARELEAPPGVPLPLGSGSGAPPQNFFLIFYIKMACSDAL